MSCVRLAKATVWPLWWLPIVLIGLLLLVLAIVLFVSCSLYNNRGEDYEGMIPPIVYLFFRSSYTTDYVVQRSKTEFDDRASSIVGHIQHCFVFRLTSGNF